jgi:hypothetical protein
MRVRQLSDSPGHNFYGHHGQVDLRTTLRHAPTDEAVRERLLLALRHKPFAHQLRGGYRTCRPMTAIGGGSRQPGAKHFLANPVAIA